MKQVVIENPILNSPFSEPKRHFRFDERGITDEILEKRRPSSYFIPIPKPKGKAKGQTSMDYMEGWIEEREKKNDNINRLRERVKIWRQGNYTGVTATTRRLLEYWTNPDREKKLFFCQIEALETAIYIAEVATKYGDSWVVEQWLKEQNAVANPKLFRLAFKMATGSGKTVVMGMLISWQALNKLANPQDSRFSDTFLIVTPGITIKDRLRVLLPNDPQNYYRQRDLLPPDLMEQLHKAKLVITNFHSFKLREHTDAGALTKSILKQGQASSPFTETPDQMVRRVCRELGTKKNVIVINDEAHHCYRRKPDDGGEALKGDERKEAEKREEEARIWISGLEAVKEKLGVKMVYDLSATPFFLKGSGYPEGTLFGWVVSDFSLIDAIECGIVKVPRVPVADDSMTGEQPTYRDLWLRIREGLPKKGRGTRDESEGADPILPLELEGALQSLYTNYEKYYALWKAAEGADQTPPVMIVVCNNTNVSKLVYDKIAGYEKTLPNGQKALVPGKYAIFSNVSDERWLARPNTILIDSEQLESGEAMSADFKKIASREIEEFKEDYRQRFPGRNADELTDEDLLREVMNTVGKPGKLGEQVKCVISVSMLTEGWDANTVTHILGVRAFGTQLLCEQVVGRGLRRRSYQTNAEGFFEPEYAEVYGVPFSFIPCAGTEQVVQSGKTVTRVRALENRLECEISFPRLTGYRYAIATEKLKYKFSEDSAMALSTADVPTKTEMQSIVGESEVHNLDPLLKRREQEVVFKLAHEVLRHYFPADKEESNLSVKFWLFPQLLEITRHWLKECVHFKANTFPQLLLLDQHSYNARDKIYQAIVGAEEGEKQLQPVLRPYDTVSSTRYVDFDTTRPVYATHPQKCHISHVVCDTQSWEQKLAQVLEDMPEVVCYVKNQGLNFTIPYTIDGVERQYLPDFVVHYNDRNNPQDLLNLILEVSGEPRKDKAAKVATARNLWVPAVNNHGGYGRWAFIQITDPWDAENTIRSVFKLEKE
ncbi:MAG: DEAD/DEAH box helicase family protein [Chloroflexi bacterium]|uniref:DEAD/DEAH box helicase family protein n=1 Tax=Candidatus Chlorohelix allophototropha TaxID=3003348 RepID=A0A8T7MAH2_9CHLR|nr:DEAD/DEAH box helicase family protein [Chloroflexota bacterium]WJW70438.1 DEAD/DEAH box helicase family protein [Chloroflexota bacterium L227-S17]